MVLIDKDVSMLIQDAAARFLGPSSNPQQWAEFNKAVDELVRSDEERIRNKTLEELATMFDSEADELEAVWEEYLASGNNGNATSYHTIPRNYAKRIRAMKENHAS